MVIDVGVVVNLDALYSALLDCDVTVCQVAIRGAVLYFVLADLAAVDVMYQFSLEWFQGMFTNCISTVDGVSEARYVSDVSTYSAIIALDCDRIGVASITHIECSQVLQRWSCGCLQSRYCEARQSHARVRPASPHRSCRLGNLRNVCRFRRNGPVESV